VNLLLILSDKFKVILTVERVKNVYFVRLLDIIWFWVSLLLCEVHHGDGGWSANVFFAFSKMGDRNKQQKD